MEAGNRAVNPGLTEMLTIGSLSLLTTGGDAAAPLVPFDATSAAAAQAARMAARLAAQPSRILAGNYPRHDGAQRRVDGADAGRRSGYAGNRARYNLIRRFGSGVPNFERANASALNHLALFAKSKSSRSNRDGP